MSEELFKNILTNEFSDHPRDIQYLFDNKFIEAFYSTEPISPEHSYKVLKEFKYENRTCEKGSILRTTIYARRYNV